MKPDRFRKYMEKQRKAIEDYKWCESEKAGKDLGEESVKLWISKNAKRFRKDFAFDDLKESLTELKVLRASIKTQLGQVMKLTDILDDCEGRILESMELLEGEKEDLSKEE
jgi:hypothetical protein